MVTRSLCLLLLLALSASAQTPRIPPPESVNRNGLVGRWIVPGQARPNAGAVDFYAEATVTNRAYSHPFNLDFGRPSAFINSGSYLKLPAATLTPPYTLMVWARGTATALGRVAFGFSWNNYARSYVGNNANGFIQAETGNPSNDSVKNIYHDNSTHSLTDGNWHHIGITLNADRVMRVYYDGKLVTTVATMGSYSGNTWQNGTVGDGQLAGVYSTRAWALSLTDARIYNLACSEETFSAIYRGLQ
jgi:hypothetical protein